MNATKPKLVELKNKRQTAKRKSKPKRGAAKMREAADKIVGRDCKPIVQALAENGKKGQMLSAKFLYGLAHTAEELDEGDGAQKFRSMALELQNSPEWTGESTGQKGNDDEGAED